MATIELVDSKRESVERYLDQFAQVETRAKSSGQEWLLPVRREAMDRFAALGFPTTHDEDWRFTNVGPVAQTLFRPADAPVRQVDAGALEPFAFAGLAAPRVVFVNGRYAPGLSALAGLPRGVRVQSLAQAITADRAALEGHLARYADIQRDSFSALNTALMEDGAFIQISRGAVLVEPIHILYVSVPGAEPMATHPRTLIVAGENSQAAVVEDYVSLGDGVAFSNGLTEMVAGDGSILQHYLIERENPQAYTVCTLRSQQGRSSSVTSHTLLLGGALVRRNIHPVLAGEGGECLINGLFMAKGRQHMDNYMRVEHLSPRCASRQFYKGILDDQAHGVFHGRIIVHKDAQKTDAKQTNMNLLLSEEAQIDTKPQLEIYADDVKCTHGATVGQIDDDAIFYLRARGIPEASAKALLLFAFAGEMLQRMKVEPVRRHLEELVRRWMPQGNLLEEM
ncbi:MAG: Fe-S cluster assembly protein SufD [candidate division NC10 bacterium]|nr:Fe-S cluster assembly protein SufD [candidate division NC10 bacterium]